MFRVRVKIRFRVSFRIKFRLGFGVMFGVSVMVRTMVIARVKIGFVLRFFFPNTLSRNKLYFLLFLLCEATFLFLAERPSSL